MNRAAIWAQFAAAMLPRAIEAVKGVPFEVAHGHRQSTPEERAAILTEARSTAALWADQLLAEYDRRFEEDGRAKLNDRGVHVTRETFQ